MIATGEVLGGKYVVERVLGAGAMGAVVAARHAELGHLVAIKTIKPGASADAEVISRFEREARAAARLQSEHAVRVTDVGRFEDGTPYMIMDFLEGEDLAQRLEREGPLPLGDAVSLFMQCCIGLHDAHELGLVHRDVKPSNVFLARRASGRIVAKVLDFGIAKATNDPRDQALTQTQTLMGSPQYMSPEQLNDAKRVDARADIWSLGATFFEAIAGAVPFPAATLAQLHVRILTAGPRGLRMLRPDVPPELEAIVLRCLARAPEDRFTTMLELHRALEEVAAGVMAIPRPLFDSTAGAGAPRTSVAPPEAFAATARGDALGEGRATPFDETVMPTSKTFSALHVADALSRPRYALVAAACAALVVIGAAGWSALWARPSDPAPLAPAASSTEPPTPEKAIIERVEVPPSDGKVGEASHEAPAATPVRGELGRPSQAPRAIPRGNAVPSATPRPAAEPKKEAPKEKKGASILNPEFDE